MPVQILRRGSRGAAVRRWQYFLIGRRHLPAPAGAEGSVRELVDIANAHGFFWGGHFKGRPDGMHFEVAKLL